MVRQDYLTRLLFLGSKENLDADRRVRIANASYFSFLVIVQIASI